MHLTWFDGVDVITFVYTHTHTHIYITVKAQSKSNTRSIHLSFFFFFLSPLAMDRRIAFSLLSISIHLSIVAFHAYYNYFWFVWSPWDNRNWNSFQSLVVLRWISLTVSLDVHPLGILIRFNDFLARFHMQCQSLNRKRVAGYWATRLPYYLSSPCFYEPRYIRID